MITRTAAQFIGNKLVKETGRIQNSRFFMVGEVGVEIEINDKYVRLFCRCDNGEDEDKICSHKAAVLATLINRMKI